MHEVVQRPRERRSLVVDLLRLNGFESLYNFMPGKKNWHMVCWERDEISLTVLSGNCHDLTG